MKFRICRCFYRAVRLCVLVGALAIVGCGRRDTLVLPFNPRPQPEVSVGDVALKNDDGTGQAGEETKGFLITNRVQHFDAPVFGQLAPGTKVKWVFTCVDTMAGKDYEAAVHKLVVGEGVLVQRLRAHVDPEPPHGWPVGLYRVEVFLEDKLVQRREYTVEPPAGEYVVAGLSLFRDNGQGERGERVQSFEPGDRMLHFEVGLGGRIPAGARARWTWIAVDTTEGGYREMASMEGELEGFGASLLNTLTSKIRWPVDWPKGTYAVRLALNGKTIHVAEFKIGIHLRGPLGAPPQTVRGGVQDRVGVGPGREL
jgi:hypothetical protein